MTHYKPLPEVASEQTLAEQKTHNSFALISTTYWQPAKVICFKIIIYAMCIYSDSIQLQSNQ